MYHYSKLAHFKKISTDGYIKPATAGVPAGEKPAVWLSSDEKWEATALIPNCMDKEKIDIFLPIRFKLKESLLTNYNIAIVSWNKHKKHGGIPREVAENLEKAALVQGSNSKKWFCCYTDIPLECFELPEAFDGRGWVSTDKIEEIIKSYKVYGKEQFYYTPSSIRRPSRLKKFNLR